MSAASFPATPDGYRRLGRWLAGRGPVVRVGVEGTGSYGAGLAAALTVRGVELVEVNRPNWRPAGPVGSPTRSTPKRPPGLP